MILHVDQNRGIECYVDADFAGGYNASKPTTNTRDCLSCTGYIIKYAGCPIIWSSKLQSAIALSTTEAEYMALSTAMREVIFLFNMMNEIREHDIKLPNTVPKIQL